MHGRALRGMAAETRHNGMQWSRSIPEPEENRKQAPAMTYACEIFL
jgi:hypothetical protein